MEIKEIKEKNIWEDFLLECEEKTFLDSWNWGEFQKMTGNKIWRFGIYSTSRATAKGEEENLFSSPSGVEYLGATALVIKIEAKRGRFLLVPHGPAIALATAGKQNIKYEILKTLLDELKKIAKEEKVDFIRVSPIWEKSEENNKIFKDLKFREAPIHMHPEASWKLDIRPGEEELLKNMRKTTRYLIRQAQKDENIDVFQRWDISDVEVFNKIHQAVVKVQKFVPFSLEYFKKEFSVFRADSQISIFFARYKKEIAASCYVIFWSNIGFYHHAALLPKYHKIPLAYLLQWEAIKEAKKRGCVLYDFWGFVDPQKNPTHPWAGPTLFKMGFGGYKKEFVKTQDLPLSKLYWLTYLFEKIRKSKRGL